MRSSDDALDLSPDYARLLVRSRSLPSKTPPRGLLFFPLVHAACVRACLAAALAPLFGCSGPLGPDVDMQATGSIAPAPAPAPAKAALPAALDAEDRRRALGAFGIALDPQGNGATVHWDNPVSKAHGMVTPVGFAYPDNGLICRKFSARFQTAAGVDSRAGAACRDKDADWTLKEIHKAD